MRIYNIKDQNSTVNLNVTVDQPTFKFTILSVTGRNNSSGLEGFDVQFKTGTTAHISDFINYCNLHNLNLNYTDPLNGGLVTLVAMNGSYNGGLGEDNI